MVPFPHVISDSTIFGIRIHALVFVSKIVPDPHLESFPEPDDGFA
jgi:hypothetical protein